MDTIIKNKTYISNIFQDLFLSCDKISKLHDKMLIDKSKKNPKNFEKIYEKYKNKVFNYIFHRVNNKSIAEETMQETFTNAYCALSHFKFQNFTYLSYLLMIAHNLVINYYRSFMDKFKIN